jgi:SHOCT-like domain
MIDDALDQVLRMVAEGRLTPAEAEPIIAALDRSEATGRPDAEIPRDPVGDGPADVIRVVVLEGGRSAVNLRIPLSLGRMAIDRLPGLSAATSESIRKAIEVGLKASIVEVDDDGDGIRISIE